MEEVFSAECHQRHAEVRVHLEESKGWRGLLTALVLTMIIHMGTFIYMWGSVTKMVEINTKRLDRLEQINFINDRVDSRNTK